MICMAQCLMIKCLIFCIITSVLREKFMKTGTVKWFNPTKGFGFIEPDDGEKDVFVHISVVERAGLGNLHEGQKIQFEVVPGRDGRPAADNLVVPD